MLRTSERRELELDLELKRRGKHMKLDGSHRWRLAGVGFVAVCLCAAGAWAAEQPKSAAAKTAPATASAATAVAVIPMKELMAHVVQFSAMNMWSRQGWVTDSSGEPNTRNDPWASGEGTMTRQSTVTNTASRRRRACRNAA